MIAARNGFQIAPFDNNDACFWSGLTTTLPLLNGDETLTLGTPFLAAHTLILLADVRKDRLSSETLCVCRTIRKLSTCYLHAPFTLQDFHGLVVWKG